ncbi:hypothetical protein FJK98_09750 [Micromonospora sp. HM134]|uniref:hypothetical protein n=1 Tax=unclassified Micromonospora TaxID=2617518 RepID=UPI00119843E8|nr:MULTISPECIES: hypothetical protein [unclassified Micromonospora]QDY07423.1 hypothetical protein FJK98_09750 [Micromonospora sp. HM134]
MNTVLSQFLTGVPTATAIWSLLLVLALTGLAVLVARPERDQATDVTAVVPPPDAPPPVADLRRYAEEVAVAAAGAAQTARRHRAAWLAAQDTLDRAWQEYDEAETAARRFTGAGALPSPRTPRTPAEYAGRERWLHQEAVAAHWRGELSVERLRDVFAHRDGWDPRRHPVEHEVMLARAIREDRRAAYRAAAWRERVAWRDAELAAEAARSLAAEAYAATQRVRPGRVPLPRTATSAATRPTPATRWHPARVG